MANVKITELNAAGSLAATDVVPVVDVSADETKKITATNLFRALPDGTAAAPALAFADDGNTGIFTSAENQLAFTTGGTQRVTIDGSGNVSISGDLTVNGATTTVQSTTVTIDDKNIELGSVATPTDTTADGGGITLKGATDKTLKWINSTGCWTFNQPMNFNDHVRIDSSGRVGIGTTSPAAPLEVVGTTNGDQLRITQSGQHYRIGREGSGGLLEFYGAQSGYNGFIFGGANGERLRINSSGNVGIGTTAPATNFQVKTSSNSAANIVSLLSGGGSTSSGNGVAIAFSNESALSRAKCGIGNVRTGTFDRSALVFYTNNDASSGSFDSTDERLRIDSSGNVGIGTSSPDSELSIGTGNTNNRIDLADERAYVGYDTSYGFTGALYLDGGGTANKDIILQPVSTGKVGIGTTAPSVPLTVNSTTDHSDIAIFHAGGGTPNRGLKISTFSNTNSNAGVELDAQHSSTGAFKFSTGGTERLRIDSSGDIFAKTNNARIGSDVGSIEYGTSTNNSVRFYSNDTERLRIDAAGRLMLGTTTQGNSSADDFTVANSANCGITVRAGATSSSSVFFSDGTSGDAEYRGQIQYQHSNDALVIATAASERLRIDSSGRLLVGTSSAHNDTDLVEFEAETAISSQDILIINGGRVGFNGTNDANTAQGIRFKACAFNSADSIQKLDTARIKFQKTGSWNTGGSVSAVSGKLIFEVASGTSASTTLTERMRIDSSGDVTITSTGSLTIPVGTTAERPSSPAQGMIRRNTTDSAFEGYTGNAWAPLGGGATGGGSDAWVVETDQTVTTSYELGSGKHGTTVSPTINSGATITVPSGAILVIL